MKPAPHGLALVQDLLNTRAAGNPRRPDLLLSREMSQEWLDGAVGYWRLQTGGRPVDTTLSDSDLPRLRAIRARLQSAVSGDTRDPEPGPSVEISGALELRMNDDATVAVVPRGSGVQWLASAVLGECSLAQSNNVWRRLKLCRSTTCSVAFYDRSNNNNRVWHDVRMCGNPVNLRASRARRRATGARGAGGEALTVRP